MMVKKIKEEEANLQDKEVIKLLVIKYNQNKIYKI